MKRLMFRSVPLFLIAFFALGTVYADTDKNCGHKEGHEKGQWLQELNLSPEQQQQLAAIKDKYHGEMKKQKKAMKSARKSLKEALKSDASDESLNAQFNKLQGQRAEFAKLRFEKILAIRAILTPEQRKKFEGMRKHHWRRNEHK